MIIERENLFCLRTEHSAYLFRVTSSGHLEHLYYGDADEAARSWPGEMFCETDDHSDIHGTDNTVEPAAGAWADEDVKAENKVAIFSDVRIPEGNLITYDPAYPDVTLENMLLEMSSYGKGDIREPFIELVHADGSRTCDFVFNDAAVLQEKPEYATLPGSYGMAENEHLCVRLRDRNAGKEWKIKSDSAKISFGRHGSVESDAGKGRGLLLELHYYLYPECDVICRSAKLINETDQPVRIDRLMSGMLDLDGSGYIMRVFTGAWAREMQHTDTTVNAGICSISSVCGSSSNRANPFFMVSRPETEDSSGICYGFNLIYSGNHLEEVQVNSFARTRVLYGMNPAGFEWKLMPGESFEAPESIMTFSAEGRQRVSQNMHMFMQEHIIRGIWKKKERPVLLNSWEAAYFDFNEEKLLKLATCAAKVGIDLFVLDDGWFGRRDDATSSLGDWTADPRKLPCGLASFSEKIHEMGMCFGIWIEPEMVSLDSDLYRDHPSWVMEVPGRPHAEGRSQRILDMANPEVVQYLTKTLYSLLSSVRIEYVKWDMNRIFSDVYSPYLPAERQGETAHRYMMGLYMLLRNITIAFPEILFEGCAAGGGRFDPGMLCYFPQIWASDNTDPLCREKIQQGYRMGYPADCISAHVSASPNQQTGRETSLAARYKAASEGILGYELDLCRLEEEELIRIREQIALYKKSSKNVSRETF